MSEGHLPMGSLGRWKGENPYIRTYEALALQNRCGGGGRLDARRGAVYCTYLNSIGRKILALRDRGRWHEMPKAEKLSQKGGSTV